MKKLILSLTVILLLSSLTSCTADELPTQDNENIKSRSAIDNNVNRDGDPPIVIKP